MTHGSRNAYAPGTGGYARLQPYHFAALRYLSDGYSTATWLIARACGFDRVNGCRATARARNILKTLERHGYVAGIRASWGSDVRWWKITDAGRSIVASIAAEGDA